MRILVIGSGGREDALSWKLAQSPSRPELFAAPGNAGTAGRGENWDQIGATDGAALVAACRRARIDLAVLGPESAIAAGVADDLREAGTAVFGPGRAAGRIETSKIFAKKLMSEYHIPTARFRTVDSDQAARGVLAHWQGEAVVKADGLGQSGSNVVMARDARGAGDVLRGWYAEQAGTKLQALVEERLEGQEVSVLALSDGKHIVPLASVCDYKRAASGNAGPNTGGMGSYSPAHGFAPNMIDVVSDQVFEPMSSGLARSGTETVGALVCNMIWTASGPKVMEFDARFGDPEIQAILPRLNCDFADVLYGAATGKLDDSSFSLDKSSSVAVVLATPQYPAVKTPLRGLPADISLKDATAFWGSSRYRRGSVDADGGRVLTVTAGAGSLADARAAAYSGAHALRDRMGPQRLQFRDDIGAPSPSEQPVKMPKTA